MVSQEDQMISVIMPVYNAGKYLREAIESVLNQSYRNLELILIDDGSEDGSGEICNEYRVDCRVKVIHKENEGVQLARNDGIKLATGEYLTFVDADDVIERNAYQMATDVFRKYKTDLVFFAFQEDISDIALKDKADHVQPEIVLIRKEELYRNYMDKAYIGGYVWNKVWRKGKISGLEFRGDLPMAEDSVFVWDSLARIESAAQIKETLYHYRMHMTSISKGAAPDKFIRGGKAWDELKEASLKMDEVSLSGICTNRLRWNLKILESLVKTDDSRADRRIFLENLRSDKEFVSLLPVRHRISYFLALRSESLFGLWIRAEYFLIGIYGRLKSASVK